MGRHGAARGAAGHGGMHTWAWGWAVPALTRGCPAAAAAALAVWAARAAALPAIELSFFKGAAIECWSSYFSEGLLLWLQCASDIFKIILEWYLKKSLKVILKTRSVFVYDVSREPSCYHVDDNEWGAKLSAKGGTDSLPPCTEQCRVTLEHLCSFPASSVSCEYHLPSSELGKKCEKQGRQLHKGSENDHSQVLFCAPRILVLALSVLLLGESVMNFLGSRSHEAELEQLRANRSSQAGTGSCAWALCSQLLSVCASLVIADIALGSALSRDCCLYSYKRWVFFLRWKLS